MFFRIVTLCILILCLTIHGSKGKRNATRKADNQEPSYSISPSYSYQYHTNEQEDGDIDVKGKDVSAPTSANVSLNGNDILISNQNDRGTQSTQSDSSPGINVPTNDGQYTEPNNYQPNPSSPRDVYAAPDQTNSYNVPLDSYSGPGSNRYSSSNPSGYDYFNSNPDPNEGNSYMSLQNQGYDYSLNQDYKAPSQSSDYAQNLGYTYVPKASQSYESSSYPSQSYMYESSPTYGYPTDTTPAPYVPAEGYASAQDKGFGSGFFFGGGGDHDVGPGFGGNGEPPPPPTIKGSIDYVLIPLILIGIAGPIFVVLYVVLGAFEAKLSPLIARSGGRSWNDVFSDSWDMLQPATEILVRSIDKGLHYDCTDQMICHLGSFGHDLGLGRLGFLRTLVESLGLNKKYEHQVEVFFTALKRKSKHCSSITCSKINATSLSSSSTFSLSEATMATTINMTTARSAMSSSSRKQMKRRGSKNTF